MCDLEIYLRKGTGNKSRDRTDVQSRNLTSSDCSKKPMSNRLKRSTDANIQFQFSKGVNSQYLARLFEKKQTFLWALNVNVK